MVYKRLPETGLRIDPAKNWVAPLNNLTFAIIDEYYRVRNSLAHVLRDRGYVIQADSVAELVKHRADCDFIFVADRGDKAESMCAEIQDNGMFYPVIAYGESISLARVVQSLRGPCAGYIKWPGDEGELWATLDILDPTSTDQVRRRVSEARARHKLAQLTSRERQVAMGIGSGFSSKELAKPLGISFRTVELHRANIMKKFGTANMASLIRTVIEAGEFTEMCFEPSAFSFENQVPGPQPSSPSSSDRSLVV